MNDEFPGLAESFYTNQAGDFGSVVNQFDRATYGTAWHKLSDESRANMFNLWLSDYQNKFNAHQAELAYEREKELINAQNEYNSPVNQMARYAEAGLNPNVIYGQINPGNQSGVASYEPQKSAGFVAKGDPRGTREQQLAQSMDILGMLGNLVKGITGMAKDVESVRNANLQNELLASQLPFEKAVANFRRGMLTQTPTEEDIASGKKFLDWNTMFDIAFPKFESTRLSGERANWQNWFLTKLGSHIESIYEGNARKSQSQGSMSEYDFNMLNSIPENIRGIVYFLLQIFGGVAKFK